METIDGVGTDRQEVGMVTEEKWRKKPEERKISNSYKKAKRLRQFRIAFSRFSLSKRAPNY